MPDSTTDAASLRALLLDARARTLALVGDLDGDRLLGPRLAIVNPPLWEIGHVGWFQEHWCLRWHHGAARATSLIAHADALYNSATVPHDARWDLPLPSLEATLVYLERVCERVLSRLADSGDEPELRYFVRLAAFHECMHAEAFSYTRQTLAYPAPVTVRADSRERDAGPCMGDVDIPGGALRLGAEPGSAFVFDNEKWAHEVPVSPFRMARAPVTNAEFRDFVEDDGYRRRALWSETGWRWRLAAGAEAPVYWTRQDGQWFERAYDVREPLKPHLPVMHVNWHEAQAYCRWARRRLPTEAEWEFAAATTPDGSGAKRRYPWGDTPPRAAQANLHPGAAGRVDVAARAEGDSAWGCRQMLGNVWEWTEDWFEPYPGFAPDPYQEYSAPWFGNHKVLRGGCWATSDALATNVYRNFYTPDRRDVYAGFRTCALQT